MMRQGTIFHSSDLESLKGRMRRLRFSVDIDDKQNAAFSDMRILGQHTVRGETSLIVEGYVDSMRPALTETFGDDIRVEHMNLEDIFVELSSQKMEPTIGATP